MELKHNHNTPMRSALTLSKVVVEKVDDFFPLKNRFNSGFQSPQTNLAVNGNKAKGCSVKRIDRLMPLFAGEANDDCRDQALRARECVPADAYVSNSDSDSEYYDAVSFICSDSDSEYYDAVSDDGCQPGAICPDPVSKKGVAEENDNGGEWQVVKNKKRRRGRVSSNELIPSRIEKKFSLSDMLSKEEMALCNVCMEKITTINKDKFEASVKKLRSYFRNINKNRQFSFKLKVNREGVGEIYEMMKAGMDAIRGMNDINRLKEPFMVLILEAEFSRYIIYISSVLDRVSPGFLFSLGDRFLKAWYWVKHINSKGLGKNDIALSFEKTYRLPDGGLSRLGWGRFSFRKKCSLFVMMCDLFGSIKKNELIDNMLLKVNGEWLRLNFENILGKIKNPDYKDVCTELFFDLNELFLAYTSILDYCLGAFGKVTKSEQKIVVETFAVLIQDISLYLSKSNGLGFGRTNKLLKTIAWSGVRFTDHFNHFLGYEKSIFLQNCMLECTSVSRECRSMVYPLRVSFLSAMLMRCESLSNKKDADFFKSVWNDYLKQIELTFDECDAYIKNTCPAGSVDKHDDVKRRLDCHSLMLTKSIFFRLNCMVTDSISGADMKEKGENYIALLLGWLGEGKSRFYEKISIEVAKLYFLIDDFEAAVKVLKETKFTTIRMNREKSVLLGRCCAFDAALEAYDHCKSLVNDRVRSSQDEKDDKDDKDEKDKGLCDIDNMKAMLLFNKYNRKVEKEGEGKETHLLDAFRLQVYVLKICNARKFEKELQTGLGGLSHIVNAITSVAHENHQFRFVKFSSERADLSFLSESKGGATSWEDLRSNLTRRHKEGFNNPAVIKKMSRAIRQCRH